MVKVVMADSFYYTGIIESNKIFICVISNKKFYAAMTFWCKGIIKLIKLLLFNAQQTFAHVTNN